MNKVTLDFENEMIEWNTDNQKGKEHCLGLRERKPAILAAMGYTEYDMRGVVDIINDFANGGMTEDELKRRLDAEESASN
jgi:hypothetical protein